MENINSDFQKVNVWERGYGFEGKQINLWWAHRVLHLLTKFRREKKKELSHFFATHNANFKHNYGIQAYSPYEPVDAPKMKYKFKNLFPLLQTFHGVSRWPNDEFKMGASIFRQLWGQIRLHFWTLYDVEDFKSYRIRASKWMIWNEFFSSKKVLLDGKYKF